MSGVVRWLLAWITIGVAACGMHTEGTINYMTDLGAWDLSGRAARLGLRASEHAVRTEDGYILGLVRVQAAGAARGPPVLLMHGLQLSAAGWLDAGNASLGALLARSGRDLWLGNMRGTHLSRRHATLRPDSDPRYWRFSADEVGRLDLPALIDHILQSTGADRLDYIGFSQGGGAFFIMCSERPEYCRKVYRMVALAPATRMLHTTSLPFRLIVQFYERNEEKLDAAGVWEAIPFGSIFQMALFYFCELSDTITKVCLSLLDVLAGPNPGSITLPVFRRTLATTPAGTSVHNMAWFGQMVTSDRFRKFDFGPERNQLRYGSETAPDYNLSAVAVPTVVMYGRNDAVVDVRDVEWLMRQLPHVKKTYEIEDPLWNHLDFVLSKNVPSLLFPIIAETLR